MASSVGVFMLPMVPGDSRCTLPARPSLQDSLCKEDMMVSLSSAVPAEFRLAVSEVPIPRTKE